MYVGQHGRGTGGEQEEAEEEGNRQRAYQSNSNNNARNHTRFSETLSTHGCHGPVPDETKENHKE
jgi:hypothetical protein